MKFKKSEVLDITGFYGLLLRCMKIREIGRSPTMPNFIYLHISFKSPVFSVLSGFARNGLTPFLRPFLPFHLNYWA